MLNKFVVRNPNIASRIVDGEAIIMTPQDEILHSLNAVGTKIWELCDGKSRVKEIIGKVHEEFNVDLKAVQKDVVEFIEELVQKGMLILEEHSDSSNKRGGEQNG